MAWLAESYPDLVPRYEAMYAASPYASPGERKSLGRMVARIVRSAGGLKPRPGVASRFHRGADPTRGRADEETKARHPAGSKVRQLKLL